MAYLAVALTVFLFAHIGGAASAKHRVAGIPALEALRDALVWLEDAFSWLFLFAPFLGLAFLSACFSGWAKARGVIASFALGLAVLSYFYVDQHYWAAVSMEQERWTAASLAVGLAPFFIGVPVFLAVMAVQAIAAAVDPKKG